MQRSLLAVALFTSACATSSASPLCATAGEGRSPSAVSSIGPPASSSALATASSRPANRADVASVDAIIGALYGSVSGPPGPSDWERVRTLFLPGATVLPVENRPGSGPIAHITTIEAFIERSSRNVRRVGFYEKEIARHTDTFGSVVHVFSTYEHRHHPDDPRPFRRGINSIQLFHDGSRYWVVSIYWDSEREGTPIPDAYLPAR
jgi:hypothetical protein